MNASEKTRWLAPSPPLAVDSGERQAHHPTSHPSPQPKLAGAHSIRIRDLRALFGDAHAYAAECSCGWRGTPRTETAAERAARRDGRTHLDTHRLR